MDDSAHWTWIGFDAVNNPFTLPTPVAVRVCGQRGGRVLSFHNQNQA